VSTHLSEDIDVHVGKQRSECRGCSLELAHRQRKQIDLPREHARGVGSGKDALQGQQTLRDSRDVHHETRKQLGLHAWQAWDQVRNERNQRSEAVVKVVQLR